MHGRGGTGKYSRVALVTDIRGGQTFDELFQALDGLREMHLDYQLLFIEAADEDIIRRYKETRHTHPLTRQGYALPGGGENGAHGAGAGP